MTISSMNHAKLFGSSTDLAKVRVQSSALKRTDRSGKIVAAPNQSNMIAQSPVATKTSFQPATTQNKMASADNSSSPVSTGRSAFSVLLPSIPDLPAPPVRYNPSATRVLDPATGTYAPAGYDSWAQLHEDTAAIVARNRAMQGYFQQVHAIIDEVQNAIATAQGSSSSEPDVAAKSSR